MSDALRNAWNAWRCNTRVSDTFAVVPATTKMTTAYFGLDHRVEVPAVLTAWNRRVDVVLP